MVSLFMWIKKLNATFMQEYINVHNFLQTKFRALSTGVNEENNSSTFLWKRLYSTPAPFLDNDYTFLK